MGFESPLALLALVAVGIPVLAHLLRRRDLRRQLLPTIALLQRAQASSRRQVRIVDLLLLILRCAIIALAALAVAAPLWPEMLAYGDGRVASVALVVDDSLSMSRGEPTLASQARARAAAIIGALPSGSEVAVVLGGDPPRVAVPRTDNLAAAAQLVTSLADGARGTRLDRALDLAEGELSGARHADRRLVVLSDFAAHASVLEARLPSHLQLRFERFGEAAPDNVAVVSARATLDPTRPSRAQLAAEVRAPGRDGEALPVVVRRGDEDLLRRDLEVVGGVARLNASVPIDPGQPAALIEVEVDDALPADDSRAVLLRPPSSVRVLVVRGDGEASQAGGGSLRGRSSWRRSKAARCPVGWSIRTPSRRWTWPTARCWSSRTRRRRAGRSRPASARTSSAGAACC